jgi:hypothetical protein
MKIIIEYHFCSPKLLQKVDEINEIYSCIDKIKWEEEYAISVERAYYKSFQQEFSRYGWESNPILSDYLRLIGDFEKNDVFVEIQFGNSSTLYRDYYKFDYGLTHGLLKLAVLIVPTNPIQFFPTRPDNISNMTEFNHAYRYFMLFPIPVPILLIGLLPEN